MQENLSRTPREHFRITANRPLTGRFDCRWPSCLSYVSSPCAWGLGRAHGSTAAVRERPSGWCCPANNETRTSHAHFEIIHVPTCDACVAGLVFTMRSSLL